MSFRSMLHCLVLNATSTESPKEASRELQLYMRSCQDMCEAISNIVNDDVFFGEIKQHKAYYLGNKGFYVPVELRSDDAVMKIVKGQCFNGGKKVDMKMNTDKNLIVNLDRIVFGFMIWLNNEGFPYSDMNVVKLIYDTLIFKLIDTFFRLQLHIRIDTCDEKIKEAKDCKDEMAEDAKECKDVKEGKEDTSMADKNNSIQNILVFYSKELKSFFSEWKHHLEAKKTDIRIITEWYKRDSAYKMKEMVKPKTQVRLCKDLKQHCSIIGSYHENINYVSMGLGQLSKDLIDLSFCDELKIYCRTLLSYDNIGSKLFANEVEKFVEILYKNEHESNIADELVSLQMRIRRRIFSYQKTMKGFLSNYSALLNHYNELNSDSQTPIEKFEEEIGSIVNNYTKALEMIQKIQAEESTSNE